MVDQTKFFSTPHNRIKAEPLTICAQPVVGTSVACVPLPFPNISVCAGFPSPAEDFTEERIDLNRLIIKHPAATFFIRVEGNSMIGAGIFPGSLLVVDRSLEPCNNSIIIAILDGEFTVKRFQKNGNSVILQPENRQYRPIHVSPESDFAVWGVVTHIVREIAATGSVS